MGEDPLTADFVEIVSGLAATGAQQIYKQLMKENAEGYGGRHEAG